MDNGQGEVLTEYSPAASSELCDGLWHNIKGLQSLLVTSGADPGGSVGSDEPPLRDKEKEIFLKQFL